MYQIYGQSSKSSANTCTDEPIVTGLGYIIEAVTNELAATQWAARRNGGGRQQSATVKVKFLATTYGFEELVAVLVMLIILTIQPPGKK